MGHQARSLYPCCVRVHGVTTSVTAYPGPYRIPPYMFTVAEYLLTCPVAEYLLTCPVAEYFPTCPVQSTSLHT